MKKKVAIYVITDTEDIKGKKSVTHTCGNNVSSDTLCLSNLTAIYVVL